ncbi:MAG: hypothetical protein RL461_1394 [Planctomycetota bacterium]
MDLFSIILWALIALIAYWWSAQGFFSSVQFFLCTLCAGALALAFWEPGAHLMLRGGFFDNYAWGLSLGGQFIIYLLLARVITERFIPSNMRFHPALDKLGGAVFGLGSGVLCIGMAGIACGFVQSTNEVMGFRGFVRDQAASAQPARLNSMAPLPNPMQVTETVYNTLGGRGGMGAFRPFSALGLAKLQPNLADVAFGLHRDTWSSGVGRTAVAPSGVRLDGFWFDGAYAAADGQPGAYAVGVTFDATTYDGGEQFIMTGAQARLLSTRARAVAFPLQWTQDGAQAGRELFPFDDTANYVTSAPGTQSAKVVLVFPAGVFSGQTPDYVVLKGLRIRLPEPQAASMGSVLEVDGGGASAAAPVDFSSAREVPEGADGIDNVNSISPLQLNLNNIGTFVAYEGKKSNYLKQGDYEFPKGGFSTAAKSGAIKGFFAPDGTAIIRLNVTRGKAAVDLHELKRQFKDKPLLLVDQNGRTFQPIGYFWQQKDKVRVRLDATKPITRLEDLPNVSSSGDQTLHLIFAPTLNAVIKGVQVGDAPVGSCSYTVVEGQGY